MHPATHPDVWRGRQQRYDTPVIRTGHPKLDAELPGAGWPAAGLTELLAGQPGVGELSLLLPMLAATTAGGGSVVLVDPPWAPYPPAMRGHGLELRHVLLVRTGSAGEALWACEQALRGARGGVVLAWPRDCSFAQLRRLQLAARCNRQACFLFRPAAAAGSASPAALRIHLEAGHHKLRITLLKGRGIRPGTLVRLSRQHQLPEPLAAPPGADRDPASQGLPGGSGVAGAGIPEVRH